MATQTNVDFFPRLVSGAVFGAALTASEVWRPDVIISQMALENFDMVQTFIVGTAVSALLVYLFERSGKLNAGPRQGVHLDLITAFDGNILGGLAVGAGMALSGACPGTAIVQLAQGIASSAYVITGAVLGGLAYDVVVKQWVQQRQVKVAQSKRAVTIMDQAGLSQETVLVGFEIMGSLIVAVAALLTNSRSTFHPILGGLFIGTAQLVVLRLTGRPVGVSTVYEGVGRAVSSLFAPTIDEKKRGLTTAQKSSIIFATGMFLSSWISARLNLQPSLSAEVSISPLRATAGGVLLSLGAHVAGGCTSGHGISGMAMFSISSVISVASMFAGGMGLSALL